MPALRPDSEMPGSLPCLEDRFGRRVDYLRLSVSDRCDLRCGYCATAGRDDRAPTADWLRSDEVERVVAAFARLGVGRVRLTGGEPLTRRDLPALAARVRAVSGIQDLSLSTNATRLAPKAEALRLAGIDRLNVSLDSLRRERFARIVGRDCLPQVLVGLRVAREVGFAPIKINMVVQKGINDDEIDALVEYCLRNGYILRLIETMPVGGASGYLDLQAVKQRLRQCFGLIDGFVPGGGPARYLQSTDRRFSVGFITPMSQHFCATCNRVRLSVTGTLYLCLGQYACVELRPLLRAGVSDEELAATLRGAIELKPERHDFTNPRGRIGRLMRTTGG